MKLGFIKPVFPNEKRVALLPQHIENFPNELYLEKNFGEILDIDDEEYIKKGCKILTREEIFKNCEAIVTLKNISTNDYKYLKKNQILIGWIHPETTVLGQQFMRDTQDKELIIVDLETRFPSIFYKGNKKKLDFIPKNFLKENSKAAGKVAVLHSMLSFGKLFNKNTKVAILAIGNVGQGAYSMVSKFTDDISIYTRKNMEEFYYNISNFNLIINCIEIEENEKSIISLEKRKQIKKGCLVVDAAGDPGRAIEGIELTTWEEPIVNINGVYYYSIDNLPTLCFREISENISRIFSSLIYSKKIENIYKLIDEKY
ncbi:MAG: hypothetical protein SO183_07035 [Fusobacterium mortiferum]|uniref:hypothetical protein n=1 Tax=Fusobacterium mortiferum TaxID=850 RepID=UPI001F252F9B|nr:hypothetical protein [Fusobacterium mortiferum]MCF2628204.1 hypothetical protein [Fusobacterium mortiferum]MDY4801373.1 hypothetical protein [Fusobacterium mortiferum]